MALRLNNAMAPKLKVFTYPLEDCHLEPGFPDRPVQVRYKPNPQFFEPVSSLAVADFIVFPVCLSDVGVSHPADAKCVCSYLPSLPHSQQFPARHIFFLRSVGTWAPLFASAVTFQTGQHRRMLDLKVVAVPYYEEQVTELLDHSAFRLRLPGARIPKIGAFLEDWFLKPPADKVARMCAAARQAREEYLGPAAQERLVVNALHQIKNANYRLNVAQMADVELLRRVTRKSPRKRRSWKRCSMC